MWTTRDQQQRAAVFHSVRKLLLFFWIIYNSHSQNLWKITDKHVVYFCVVLVLYSVQDTLTVTGDSSLISACSTAKHQSGRKSRRAPLMLQTARGFLLWLSLTKVITSRTCRQFSAEVQTNWTSQQIPPAKKLPVCSVWAVKQVRFCHSSAFFFSYLLCHLSHPVGGAVAKVWALGAPGSRHRAEEGGHTCSDTE